MRLEDALGHDIKINLHDMLVFFDGIYLLKKLKVYVDVSLGFASINVHVWNGSKFPLMYNRSSKS